MCQSCGGRTACGALRGGRGSSGLLLGAGGRGRGSLQRRWPRLRFRRRLRLALRRPRQLRRSRGLHRSISGQAGGVRLGPLLGIQYDGALDDRPSVDELNANAGPHTRGSRGAQPCGLMRSKNIY